MSEFEILSKVIEISHFEEHVEKKLIKILNYIKDSLELCVINFLIFKEDLNMFNLNYSTDSGLLERLETIPAYDGALLGTASSMESTFKNDFKPDASFKSSIVSDFTECKNFFALPIKSDGNLFGIVTGGKRKEFSKLDEKLLSLITVEISGMILSASSFVNLNKNINEVTTLLNISKLFSMNEELSELCNKIVERISVLLYSDTAFLELYAPGIEEISKKRYIHNKGKAYDIEGELIQNIINEVKNTGESVYIKDSSSDKRCAGFEADFLCALFIPIKFNSSIIGVIGLLDKEINLFIIDKYFSEDDFNILSSLSSQLANFVENTIIMKEKEAISRENEIKSHELSILHDVSNAMMTTMKLDMLLYRILTAVTTGGGLGFNRAGLFLINHKTNMLQGMLGIGPDSVEDAARIWAELEKEPMTLAQQISIGYETVKERKSAFDERIKSIRVSLSEKDYSLTRAIDEKRPVLVELPEDGSVQSKCFSCIDSKTYAIVPLMAKDKVLGALFVDNNITKSPITEENLNFLSLFANQAGLAIENSTLYSNLKKANTDLKTTSQKLLHSEKLAALGEMAADVAHEIKNPLTSIGGFARRLNKRFDDEYSPEKTYTNIIIKEVSRLEKILNEILSFSKEEGIANFRFNNLNSIINETLIIFDNEFLENNITVTTNLNMSLPNVKCDYQQIKQAIINLINNSCQAMLDGGSLMITTRKALLRNRDSVVIEITDTGGGINGEVLHNIFNPFFTTKDGGTGLGLAITHRLIVNHQGSIEVNNNPGYGVTFILNLPMITENEQ